MKRICQLLLFLVPSACYGQAANVYLSQAGAGSVNGSSCANARAISYFNSASNWGTGATQIGAGTTVHLCGTISSSIAAPASSGGTVTVFWETGAGMAQAAAAYYIRTGAFTNNWIFSGGTPCGQLPTGPVACNGYIGNTANGTNLANQIAPSWAFDINNTNGTILIENLEIKNMYVHAPPVTIVSCTSNGTNHVTCTTSGTAGFNAGQTGIDLGTCPVLQTGCKNSNAAYNVNGLTVFSTSGTTLVLTYPTTVAAGSGTGGLVGDDKISVGFCCGVNAVRADFLLKDLTIQDCQIHDAAWAVFPNPRAVINARIEIMRTNFYNNDHDIAIGTSIGAPSYDVSIHDDWFHDFQNWDNVANVFHHDGIHLFPKPTDMKHAWIYNDKFGGGTKDLWENTTAYLFPQGSGGGPSNVTVYNDVFLCQGCKNPFLVKQGGGPGFRMYNNTGMSTGLTPALTDPYGNVPAFGLTNTGTGEEYVNNIMVSAAPQVDFENGTFAAIHHNLYADLTACNLAGNGCWMWTGTPAIRTKVFATWEGLSGETNSLAVSSAGIDATGKLLAVSPATGAGFNLSAKCAENADMAALCKGSTFGNTVVPITRPTNWSIGADEFTSGASVPIAGLSPVTFNFGSSPVGTSASPQTFTLSNTGTAALVYSSIVSSDAEFALTGTCGGSGSVAASGSCTIIVTFTPTSAGLRTATLTVTDNASPTTQTVALSGTGAPAPFPISSPSNPFMLYANQPVSTPSALQSVALFNTGTATLHISSIALGGANSGDFVLVPSPNNVCGATLPAGGFCLISATFIPTTTGLRLATINVTDDGGSPQIALIGNMVLMMRGNGKITGSGVLTVQ